MFWVENNHQINAAVRSTEHELPIESVLQALESSQCEISQGSLLILLELALFHPKVLKIYRHLFSSLQKLKDVDLVGSDADRRTIVYEVLKKLDDLVKDIVQHVSIDQGNEKGIVTHVEKSQPGIQNAKQGETIGNDEVKSDSCRMRTNSDEQSAQSVDGTEQSKKLMGTKSNGKYKNNDEHLELL